MQSGRLASLIARKAQLDSEVQQETSRLAPNQFRLTALKRQKLIIKEEIERLAEAS